MRYWLTTHWPHYRDAVDTTQSGIHLPDGRHRPGDDVAPGDRVLIYEATQPFKLEGDRLMVNVDARGGEVTVEVLDEAGRPLAGFSDEEVLSATKLNELRWQPRWKTRADLSDLRHQIVRLKFHLRDATLYAFQIVGEQAGQ